MKEQKDGFGCRVLDGKHPVTFLVLCLISLALSGRAVAQECPDPAPQTSGTHVFRQLGETIEIPIGLADCQVLGVTLRWTNGRNNGSKFNVTFLDSNDQPIYTRGVLGFMTGTYEFPLLGPSSIEPQPWLGSRSLISLPASVRIQTVRPFNYPANLTYTVTRVARHPRPKPPVVNRGKASGDKGESLDYAKGTEGKAER
jgi:hypothetical protein